MSSKVSSNAATNKSTRKPFVQSEFVDYDLSAEDKALCKAQILDVEQFDALLVRLIEGGYKLSVKWDTYTKCNASFLISDDPLNENFGLILTGRGSTPLKAIKQVLYKHFQCLGGDWRGYSRPGWDELDD